MVRPACSISGSNEVLGHHGIYLNHSGEFKVMIDTSTSERMKLWNIHRYTYKYTINVFP